MSRGTRRVVAGGAAVVALAVGGVLVATLGDDGPGAPGPAVTTVTPTPVPTPLSTPGEAIERPWGTPLSQALPRTVSQWLLAESARGGRWEEEWGALEAYTETYVDSDDPFQQANVRVGRWSDTERAQEFFDTMRAEITPKTALHRGSGADAMPQEGAVEVDGRVVGQYVALYQGDFTANVLWRNDTVVVWAHLDADQALGFYRAYAL